MRKYHWNSLYRYISGTKYNVKGKYFCRMVYNTLWKVRKHLTAVRGHNQCCNPSYLFLLFFCNPALHPWKYKIYCNNSVTTLTTIFIDVIVTGGVSLHDDKEIICFNHQIYIVVTHTFVARLYLCNPLYFHKKNSIFHLMYHHNIHRVPSLCTSVKSAVYGSVTCHF